MPTRTEILSRWKPRHDEQGFMDSAHSSELSTELTAVFVALGHKPDVARLAAGSVVNFQHMPDFDLVGTHVDPTRAFAALRAIEAWVEGQVSAQARAA